MSRRMIETPSNSVSAVYTPGHYCGYHCSFCMQGKKALLPELSKTGILTPEDVYRTAQVLKDSLDRFILFNKIAGHSGDIFAMRDVLGQNGIDEVVESLVSTLSDSDTHLGQDGNPRVQVVTNGTFMIEDDFESLKKYQKSLSLVFSIDAAHHNGSGLCGHKMTSAFEMADRSHYENCGYIKKLRPIVELATNALEGNVFVNSYSLVEDSRVKGSLSNLFRLTERQVLLGTPYDPAENDAQRTSQSDYNTNLMFFDKKRAQLADAATQQVLYGYLSFRDLLLGNSDEHLTSLLNPGTLF